MPAAIGDQKQCCRCKEIKYISEFNKRSRNKDGLSFHCKLCAKIEADSKREHLREADRKSYYHNREKRIAKSSKYNYEKRGKELPEYWKELLPKPKTPRPHKEAKEKELERIRNYKRENKEKMREDWKKYYYSNLEENRKRGRINTRKYKTAKAGLPNSLLRSEIEFLLSLQNRKCARCKNDFDKKTKYEIDHVMPVSKGGGLTLNNVQLLCRSCNASKRDNTIWYRKRPELLYSEVT